MGSHKKTEISEGVISNGTHLLSGVEMVIYKKYFEEDFDALLLVLDGNYYIAYLDTSDGYRSYTEIFEINDLSRVTTKVINTFEPQPVIAFGYRETFVDNDYIEHDNHGIRLLNKYGGLILEVYTDFGYDYYPVGHFEYHPENLPCNCNKNPN